MARGNRGFAIAAAPLLAVDPLRARPTPQYLILVIPASSWSSLFCPTSFTQGCMFTVDRAPRIGPFRAGRETGPSEELPRVTYRSLMRTAVVPIRAISDL